VTTDDLERDRVLAQRIAIFSWIEEQHLDVPEGPESRGFLMFAQQGLPFGTMFKWILLSCALYSRIAED
jgi:hypothetical protein